jgi:hypothetical protein
VLCSGRVRIVAIFLFAVSLGAGLWVLHQTSWWPAGDSPHYGIMTHNLVHHGTFDIKPSFNSDDYVGVFYGNKLEPQINPHYFTMMSPHWYSIHSFGLPLLVAPFLQLGLQFHFTALHSCMSAMAALSALAVVVTYLYSKELVGRNHAALVAAFTLLGSLSFLSLNNNLFPDLPTATMLTTGLLCLARLRRHPTRWSLYAALGAISGFTPYLHIKTGLMALTLPALAALHWWRDDRDRKNLFCLLVPSILLGALYVVKIHQWYHTWIITAPFNNDQMFHFVAGQSLVAGLLDTTKGLLPSNPAYLLIVAGLPVWWKRDRHSLITALVVLGPSLLLQSTFSDWAGGYSPLGRYLMPYVLATLPAVGFLYRALRLFGRTLMALLLLAGLWLGTTYVHRAYKWNYAGERNLFLDDLRRNLGAPIFDGNLHIAGHDAMVTLGFEVMIVLAVLVAGVVVATRDRRTVSGDLKALVVDPTSRG